MNEIRKPDKALSKILPQVQPHSDVIYKPSQYVLSFEHQGKFYCFNNLTRQCIEGTLPDAARAGEGYDEMIRAQFLVPEDKDECAYYNSISTMMRTFFRKKGISGYTILPTLGCNARCIYCYEEGMKPVTMTPEIVEQTIRFIMDTHDEGKVHLHWFGGEPLLGVAAIDRICTAMREAGLEYQSGMISNGSLITPEIIAKMQNEWKLTHIQISMDGAEEDYISRKSYFSYNDDYHHVMDAISDLSEAEIKTTIRCNVDEENWARIPQFLEDLKANVSHKNNVGLYFCPLNSLRMSEGDVAIWKKIRDVRPSIEAAGFNTVPFMGIGSNFRVNHCKADAGGVVICPDGSLYLCDQCLPESRFGDVHRGITDETARREFCRVDHIREKCSSCPFLPDCTSFTSCPVQDMHCREVHELMVIDTLKSIVENKADEGGENPIC